MAIDSEAQCDDVYSAWEKHKLAVSGLRKLALVTALGAGALLAADLVLFRVWRPPEAPNGLAARISLGVLLAASLVVYLVGRAKGSDLKRPFKVATALVVLASGVGAYAAAAAGGPSGYFAFGLVPLLFAWPVVMPGGVRDSVVPAAGGLVVHLLALQLASATGLGREGRVLIVALVLAVAATIACGQIIEFWRRRAAAASTTDWLTGALSKEHLVERLKALCGHRQRSLAPVSLVMLDIDRFKDINLAHGRRVGDEILELLVNGVKAEIRGNDFVGRYGKDEFLLVLDECEGQNAVSLVERLRRKVIDSPMPVGDQQIRVTFSVGVVSMAAGDPLVPEDLLRAAEKALETSMETGRNRTSVTGSKPVEEPVTEP